MKKLNIVCPFSLNDFRFSAGLLLGVLVCFATVTAQAETPFDLVEEGMTTNQVNELLGSPIYERKGSSKYAFAWIYCRILCGEPQSKPGEHPHFWIEFSKDDETVQKKTAFLEKEWPEPRLHAEDEIKYVFTETFFTNALAELPPIIIELDSSALKTELAVWLQKKLPESVDIERITEDVFNEQVKANVERQIEDLNKEANKMAKQPYEKMSSGMISFSGPVAQVLHQAKKLETGLAVDATRYAFPCDPNIGRWEIKGDPRGIHTNDIKVSGNVQLKAIPIRLDAFSQNRSRKFIPRCEVEVFLHLELSGTPVGGFNPSQDLSSTTITIQPQATLTVTRTIKTGRGIKCDAKQPESIQKTFAPESLRYTAKFEAIHKEKE